jgi:hypothetical protein
LPFGEFSLALQQNAKVENDWYETRDQKLLPLCIVTTPEEISV